MTRMRLGRQLKHVVERKRVSEAVGTFESFRGELRLERSHEVVVPGTSLNWSSRSHRFAESRRGTEQYRRTLGAFARQQNSRKPLGVLGNGADIADPPREL